MTAGVQGTGVTPASVGAILIEALAFTAAPGEVTAILERQPSVSSALLRALISRRAPRRGDLRVGNLAVPAHAAAIRRQTTWIAPGAVVEPHLTTRQNVALFLRLSPGLVPEPAEMERALRDAEVPDRVFDHRAERLRPRERLSLWLAVARLRGSALLLLDDPTALLNPGESRRAVTLIREHCARGVTVLLSTHDPGFAEAVADTRYTLDDGRLERVG